MKDFEIVFTVLGCLATPDKDEVERLNRKLKEKGIDAVVATEGYGTMCETISVNPENMQTLSNPLITIPRYQDSGAECIHGIRRTRQCMGCGRWESE